MPQWVYVNEIGKHEGQEVTLKGWLYNKRRVANCISSNSVTALALSSVSSLREMSARKRSNLLTTSRKNPHSPSPASCALTPVRRLGSSYQ